MQPSSILARQWIGNLRRSLFFVPCLKWETYRNRHLLFLSIDFTIAVVCLSSYLFHSSYSHTIVAAAFNNYVWYYSLVVCRQGICPRGFGSISWHVSHITFSVEYNNSIVYVQEILCCSVNLMTGYAMGRSIFSPYVWRRLIIMLICTKDISKCLCSTDLLTRQVSFAVLKKTSREYVCAIDEPSEILHSMRYKTKCAFMCLENTECTGVNWRASGTCELFLYRSIMSHLLMTVDFILVVSVIVPNKNLCSARK